MKQEYTVGQSVVYVDEMGARHNALVSVWWKQPEQTHRSQVLVQEVPGEPQLASGQTFAEPSCNLLFLSSDSQKTDSYGRQLERRSSCVHKSLQGAHGNFWCWSDEV